MQQTENTNPFMPPSMPPFQSTQSGNNSPSGSPKHTKQPCNPEYRYFNNSFNNTCSNNSDGTDSNESLIKSENYTNRFWQKTKYLMMKKKIIIPVTALVTMLCVLCSSKSFDISKPFELIKAYNGINPFNILGGLVIASLALSLFCNFVQIIRTKEHKITKRNPEDVLEKVSSKLPNNKDIKYIMLDQSNGKRSYFELHTLLAEGKGNPIGQVCYTIDKENKINGHFMYKWSCSILNRRIFAPILLTALVFGHITFPLVHTVSFGLNFATLASAYTTNCYQLIVPTVLLLGAIVINATYNIYQTNSMKVTCMDNKENIAPEQANKILIKCIENELCKKNPNPGSRVTEIFVEFVNHPEEAFYIN